MAKMAAVAEKKDLEVEEEEEDEEERVRFVPSPTSSPRRRNNNRDATRLSVLLSPPQAAAVAAATQAAGAPLLLPPSEEQLPVTPFPDPLRPHHLGSDAILMSTPDAQVLVVQAAKNALIAARTSEIGVQCNLTGSLLLTTSIDDDDNEDEDDMAAYQEIRDIQEQREHQKKVRRLHHWHAMSGSADLLEKNPGAYEYLLQCVSVDPTESKAIVRDARCTYAVTSMTHQRTPDMRRRREGESSGFERRRGVREGEEVDGGEVGGEVDGGEVDGGEVDGGEVNGESKQHQSEEGEAGGKRQGALGLKSKNDGLTPFASSLCNILSCFCTMFHMKFVSGMNYIAGYCLIVCRGDEEASFWLFVAIHKKVKILFMQGTMKSARRVMELFGATLTTSLPSLSKHMRKCDVDPKIWMLSNLQTLFSRNTYPRNYTKAVWDAFLVSSSPMEVLVRIAVAMIESMSTLIFAATNHSDIIQLLQNPPVDLIRAEPLLTHALKYKLTKSDERELQALSENTWEYREDKYTT